MMTKNKYYFGFLLSALLFLLFMGCEPITNDGSYVDPITLYEKVGGNWQLVNIRQVDETAKSAGISPNEAPLYAQFQFSSFALEWRMENNQPSSYQVIGSAPELFPNTGYWQLDTQFPYANGTAPKILLYSDAAQTVKTGELSITSMPGAKAEMELKLTRTSQGVPFVSYVYSLVK
jgi:hypothetical protein